MMIESSALTYGNIIIIESYGKNLKIHLMKEQPKLQLNNWIGRKCLDVRNLTFNSNCWQLLIEIPFKYQYPLCLPSLILKCTLYRLHFTLLLSKMSSWKNINEIETMDHRNVKPVLSLSAFVFAETITTWFSNIIELYYSLFPRSSSSELIEIYWTDVVVDQSIICSIKYAVHKITS